MTDAQIMVMELGSAGFSCAQILLAGALRMRGEDNPDLVRAMSGLAQGGGCSGELCGALSGGLCLIGLYCGKGDAAEQPHPQEAVFMESLVSWFREQPFAANGITCDAILGDGPLVMDPERCGAIVAAVWEESLRLLVGVGIDPSEGRVAL